MTEGKNWSYFQGILAAHVAVAEITGAQRLEGMADREWKLICEINRRLADLAAVAVNDVSKR